MACGTIWGCATNKNYCYINVVCIQIVPHWDTNWECGIIQGNMVFDNINYEEWTSIYMCVCIYFSYIMDIGIFLITHIPKFVLPGQETGNYFGVA